MADINPYITETGDYLLTNGAMQNNNSLISELYFSLNTPLGSYLYDKTLGNELLNLQYAPPITTIQQMLTNALIPLINAGRITDVSINVIIPLLGAYKADINCSDNTGQPVKYTWNTLES